jgi:hypothetical protein
MFSEKEADKSEKAKLQQGPLSISLAKSGDKWWESEPLNLLLVFSLVP